jgi:hypothetical protein
MSAEANDRPAAKESEAEVLDFEVVDDGRGIDHSDGEQGFSPQDMAAMGPEMVVQVFRDMIKEKLKRWFIHSLIWATVLLFFWEEHLLARIAFGIWAFIAGVHLAFLLYGWYASGKQGAKLAQVFGGLGGGLHGRVRDE